MSYSGLSLSTALVLRFFVGRGFSFRGWTGAPLENAPACRGLRCSPDRGLYALNESEIEARLLGGVVEGCLLELVDGRRVKSDLQRPTACRTRFRASSIGMA